MKKFLSILALVASASMAMATFTPITNVVMTLIPGVNDQLILQSFVAAGNTYTTAGLGTGTTTLTNGAFQANLSRMDDLDLNTLATGAPVQTRTVMWGGLLFTNQNGSLPDFFMWEGASGLNPDDMQIAAVFEGPTSADSDDILGVSVLPPGTVSASGWGDSLTNLTANAIAQGGQDIVGLAWDITDLKDAAGVNLASSAVIKGIAITVLFGSIDPCAFLAVVPPSGIDHFKVIASVASTNVGDAFSVEITAEDSLNMTVNNSFTTVNMTAAGTLMEFDWNNDGTFGDKSGKLTNGVAVISARNKRAETTTPGIVATAGAAGTPTPAVVTTTALAFSKLQVLVPGETGAPGTATGKNGNPTVQGLGAPFNVTVNAVDLYFNFLAGAPADSISIVVTNELGVSTASPVVDAPLAGGTVVFGITFTASGPTNYIVAADVTNPAITNGLSGVVISSQSLVWQGDGGSGGSNRWDVLTSANWTNLVGTVLPYNNGNFVAFNDTGSATPAVNIVGTVTPISVDLNSANNYSFISTNNGGIAGTTYLNKVGSGNLRLATSNSYTGGTRFTDGVLTVAHSNAVPNSGAFIFTNAALYLETNLVHDTGSTRIVGSPAGFGGSFTIAAVGGNRALTLNALTWGGITTTLFPGEISTSLILGRASDNTTLEIKSRITLSGGGIGGDRRIVVADGSQAVDVLLSGQIDDTGATPGNLVKQGAGTLQLSAPNSNYDGDTVIEDGKLLATGGWNKGTGRTITLGDGGSANATLQLGSAIALNNVNIGVLSTSGGGTYKVIGGNPTNNSIITFVSNIVTTASSTLSLGLGGAGANENNLGLTKATANYTLTLDAANTYTGPTTISAGTLALGGSGSINGTTNIDVQAGATFDVSAAGGFTLGSGKVLRGNGSVNGNVIVNGNLTPGAGTTGIGKLTFTNNLTLGATAATTMEIHSSNATNDNITVLGSLTGGGTLTINNSGSTAALTNGQTFQLFSGAVSGFSSVTLPATPVFLQWNNKLAVDGSIALVALPTPAPAVITNTVSGPTLTLNWPAGQGWTLQAQTNSIAVGIATNWVSVSTVPPFVTTLNPANPTVFYRLWFPVFP